jgi:ribose transport system permease protein
MLAFTPVGRYMHATGGNAEAARLTGVRTGKWIWVALITSSTVSGLAGVLYASLAGPSLTYGPALLLPAFAAVFLGSTQFRPGRFNVWGTIVAVYVLAIGVQGLSYVTSVQWLNDMFNGVALIAAVAFAGWRQRAARSKPLPPADTGPGRDSAGSDSAAGDFTAAGAKEAGLVPDGVLRDRAQRQQAAQ